MTHKPHSSDSGPQEPQGGLFDDEPKSNSPEDLGLVTPPGMVYGTSSMPEPDPPPVNLSSNAIQLADAHKFVDWIWEKEIPTHIDVTPGRILIVLSGMGRPDLRWLCGAILQAGRAPKPETMKKAVIARNVKILRPGGDPEETQKI